jgi:hypothetical protein
MGSVAALWLLSGRPESDPAGGSRGQKRIGIHFIPIEILLTKELIFGGVL